MSRWTVRRNGIEMTTLRMNLHVPHEMVQWITERTPLSEAKALAWIKEHAVILADTWHTLAYDDGADSVYVVHVDDTDGADPFEAYEGEAVALR